MGSQICSDYIIVDEGANYIAEDTNGTCKNAIITRLGKTVSLVELISFKAKINGNKNILLTWETSNENNNFSFNIERLDPNKLIFEKIGFIAAHGKINSKNSYSFIDKSPGLDQNYKYRLIQINSDNSFSILNTIKVEASQPEKYFLSQNYPNPFNPSTKIEFGISTKDHVILKIYDVLGKEVAVLINEEKSAGNYSVTFEPKDLPSGIYFYELQSGNFNQIKKMVLIR